jgi:cytokinin dehydrogenase
VEHFFFVHTPQFLQKMFFLSMLLLVGVALAASVCDKLNVAHVLKNGLTAFAQDFGGVAFGEPACVVIPQTIEDVQTVIKFARLHGLTVTVRGNGHSTGGQSLNANNIVIDMSTGFGSVGVTAGVADPDHLIVGAGAKWLDVFQKAESLNKRVPALVDSPSEVTVGGVLSVGGTSTVSKSHGMMIDAIVSFDAVDGKGNIHRSVSATNDKALFAAVRGGFRPVRRRH